MNYRAVFLADGSSDEPLGEHLENLCAQRNLVVRVTTPDFRLLRNPPKRTIEERLRAIANLGDMPDILFVHRDAETQPPAKRVAEVAKAVKKVGGINSWVAVVPIRMTEAWLLVDEPEIRFAAGRPLSTHDLGIPPVSQIERKPDPKALLNSALIAASGLSGRELEHFKKRFGEHRRLLLQRLDLNGPVRQLRAWQALESEIDGLAKKLTP